MSIADLRVTQDLQQEAEGLHETLERMTEMYSGAVRQQITRLSLKAFERYQRRRQNVANGYAAFEEQLEQALGAA